MASPSGDQLLCRLPLESIPFDTRDTECRDILNTAHVDFAELPR